eukprot:scaffold70_cov242-Pinguiococcus_pyrenoidosus.AAC.2
MKRQMSPYSQSSTGFTRMKGGIQSLLGSNVPCFPQLGSPRRVPSTKARRRPSSSSMQLVRPATNPVE